MDLVTCAPEQPSHPCYHHHHKELWGLCIIPVCKLPSYWISALMEHLQFDWSYRQPDYHADSRAWERNEANIKCIAEEENTALLRLSDNKNGSDNNTLFRKSRHNRRNIVMLVLTNRKLQKVWAVLNKLDFFSKKSCWNFANVPVP